VAIQPIWPFYSQNAPITYFILFLKKSKKFKRKNQKKKKMLGWLNHPKGGGWPPRLA
jgi:hypothetical protein